MKEYDVYFYYILFFFPSMKDKAMRKPTFQILLFRKKVGLKQKTWGKLKGGHDASFARMSVLDSIAGEMIQSPVCATCFSGSYKSKHALLQQEEAYCHSQQCSGPAELIPLPKNTNKGNCEQRSLLPYLPSAELLPSEVQACRLRGGECPHAVRLTFLQGSGLHHM